MFLSKRATPLFLASLVPFASAARAEEPPALALADVLRAVRERSPELVERRRAAKAQAARPRGVGLPEDPTLSFEWWQQPVDFSMVPLMVTARQALPWPSRLHLARRAAEREARTTADEADSVESRLLAEARRAYADLALADLDLAINDRVRAIQANLVQVTDSRYRVGKAVQADLLKSQSELLMVESERFDFERDRSAAAARLNGLMDRPADTPIGAAVTPLAVVTLPSEKDLLAVALEHNPDVRRARDALAAAEARLALAGKEALPDLAVWASYMVDFHGVDTFTAGVSSSVPVFASRRRDASVAAARQEVEAARAALDGIRRRTDVAIRSALAQLEAASRHVRLHRDKLVPLAELTLQSALASYEADRVDFPALLEAARAVREHHQDHFRFLAEYQRRLANLEEATGTDLGESGATP